MIRAPADKGVAPSPADRGSASVLLLGVVAVLVVLAVTLGLVVQAVAGRTRAQTAADLAAISAARAAQRAAFGGHGARDPCGVAAEVAERNGAVLAACEEDVGGVVAVEVVADAGAGVARAEARAGPRPP